MCKTFKFLRPILCMQVTRQTMIGEVVQKYPKSVEVMLKMGLHCFGCNVSLWESLESGCKGHNMPEEKIDNIIEELNKFVVTQKPIEVPADFKVEITDKAVNKIRYFIAKNQKLGYGLRIAIIPGGCAGLTYQLDLDQMKEEDIVVSRGGVSVLIDKATASHINGSNLDYAESLQLNASGFVVNNPNVQKTCHCGASFR